MSATLDRIRAQRAILAAREGDGETARAHAAGLSGEPRRLVEEALEMEKALGSLFGFLLYVWPVLHGARPFLPAPYVRVMCDWIEERITYRRPNGYLAVPPGAMKSVVGSVLSAPFRWLHDPTWTCIWLSGSDRVVSRDSGRARYIIRSERYQRLLRYQVRRLRELDQWRGGPWDEVLQAGDQPWAFRDDKNERLWFELDSGGGRQCLSTRSTQITGLRGGMWGVDDALDASEVIRGSEDQTIRRLLEVRNVIAGQLWNRIDDQRDGHHARMVIGQRLHDLDVGGWLIRMGWDHLCLPAEYDPEHPHASPSDPRSEPGELLHPVLLSSEILNRQREVMGPSQYAAQYRQAPQKEGGNELAEALDACPRFYEHPSTITMDQRWASIDATFGTTKATSSRVAIEAMGRQGAILYLYDLDADVMTWHEMRQRCLDFSRAQSPGLDSFVVETKALGPALVEDLQRVIRGVEGFSPGAQSKESRIGVLAARMRSGQVYLPHPDATWLRRVSVSYSEIATLLPIARARGDRWPDALGKDSGRVSVPWVVMFEAECRDGTGRNDLPDAAAQGVIWEQRKRPSERIKLTPAAPEIASPWFSGDMWDGSGGF